jgi:hypothetical protein
MSSPPARSPDTGAEITAGVCAPRFSAAQGRESDNGQCLNPGHNDGCHRLYKAAVTGRAELPSFVLTAAETLSIRREITLGPGRRAARRETR